MGMMATGHYTGDIRDYFGDDLLGATTPTNFVFKALKKHGKILFSTKCESFTI